MLLSKWMIQYMDQDEGDDLYTASPDYVDHFWIPASVPGDVHSTLIQKGVIDHPFYNYNDVKCRWVEEKVWWYRTEFFWSEETTDDERVELTFEGLDTYATVYVNGLETAHSDNMFLPLTLDVTRELVKGRNVIAVKFDPISSAVSGKDLTHWAGFSHERIWTRKAQMNFGWDWGPRLVTAGIWKPVHVKKHKRFKWESVFVHTVTADEKEATVEIELTASKLPARRRSYDQKPKTDDPIVEARLTLLCGAQVVTEHTHIDKLSSRIKVNIPSPMLWWTHDLGSPNLYELTAELIVDGEQVDVYKDKVGVRTIEVETVDQHGNNVFTFILNGVRIFAKGANWIPLDSFIGDIDSERYRNAIALSREANMNMLRVWGGGIYEKETFYEECDRQGMLVWQDFMFACALYPDYNRNFMENVRQEVSYVVTVLRNHACIGIWCGNNENDWIYEVQYSSGNITSRFYGEKIYHELMPDLIQSLDPSRLYWPSSPYGGNDDNAENAGDRHNWQVWHGQVYPRKFGEPEQIDYSVEGVSFKNFATCNSTFVSEFGMHASSNKFTLQHWIPQESFYWESEELAYRNKDYHHQKGMLLMEGYTGIPENIEEYINFSMLTQAEGLKYGIEHYRRRKFRSSGTLIWQLNDCWPGTSWSIIDYHLLPKASYYYVKKCYEPVLYSAEFSDREIKFWTVNDLLEELEDVLKLNISSFDGHSIWNKEYKVTVGANSRVVIAEFEEDMVLGTASATEVVLTLTSDKEYAPRNMYYLRDHKELNLPITRLRYTINEEQETITIHSDKLARMVRIDIPQAQVTFSDNFFDLSAGETKTVTVTHLQGQRIRLGDLEITALNAKQVDLSCKRRI